MHLCAAPTSCSCDGVRLTTVTTLHIQIVAAQADRVAQRRLELAAGATLADALAALAALKEAGTPLAELAKHVNEEDVGIWGRRMPLTTVLADGDRVELYRPITADPKLARHRRASEQGYRWQGRTRRAARGGGAPT